MSSALSSQSGLPDGGTGSHGADLLRALHEQHAGPLWSYARLPDQPIGDTSELAVQRQLVAVAVGRLTQEHRDVLRECCFRGRSVAQAAHALGIAPGTVKSRTYYALRALRLAIEELSRAE